MRFAFVPFAVLAASLTFAAPITPTAPLIRSELVPASFPWPWPLPVQYVTVTNWPDVQPVSGTVNVGNLPLDAGGAVRITSAPARQPMLVDLLTGEVDIDCSTPFVSPVQDVRGYSRAGVRLDGSSSLVGTIEWRWEGDAPGAFIPVFNSSDNYSGQYGQCGSNIVSDHGTICGVSGVELRIVVRNPYCNAPNPLRGIKVSLVP